MTTYSAVRSSSGTSGSCTVLSMLLRLAVLLLLSILLLLTVLRLLSGGLAILLLARIRHLTGLRRSTSSCVRPQSLCIAFISRRDRASLARDDLTPEAA